MPQLSLYNSLAKEKQDFTPLDPSHIRIYACGPTVYGYAHIGNARMAASFDVLARLLRVLYPKVTYVSNITDIEDKIIDAARKSGEEINVLTQRYTKIYNEDMAALNITVPDIQPRATEHVGDMLEIIADLIAKGHAYEKDGHVLFHVPSFEMYGQLSGRSRDEQIAGARVDPAPYKKDPADFVLWKPSTPDQPGWDSPYGRGRPGWHIECSAMAGRHLGLPFDIHGGGADLKFPHHENEIAQSCCSAGCKENPSSYAKYWVHNGFLTVEGEKMSKSIGNFVLTHELLEQKIPGEAIRMTLLSAHYRQPLDWSAETLKACQAQLDRFYRVLYEIKGADSSQELADTPLDETILEALCDDLNMPRVIAALNDLCQKASASKDPALRDQLLKAGNLIGLLEQDPAQWLGYDSSAQMGADGSDGLDPQEVSRLLEERAQAKKDKNFARADEIRDYFTGQGFTIEDTATGPRLKSLR